MAAPAPPASRKRAAAPDDEPTATGSTTPAAKRPRRYALASVDGYEQLDVVGEGASGVVIMARHRRTGNKKMHASHVIHRDIKPENILNSFGDLKVCDFGSATFVNPAGKPYKECLVGTLPYTSPEQLAGNHCYGPGVDMWALGCIMGELLTGAPLFGGDMTEKELLANLSANLDDQLSELFYDVLPELSPAAREVLSGLLAFDPEKRMTAAEALEHRWFAEEPKKANLAGFAPLFG
uniref:[RNA-polymerase]-subunit kinase n=1 Tax=Oryza glumipatula TaxID=40148 RepID=A0A0E0B811_9ORYZ